MVVVASFILVNLGRHGIAMQDLTRTVTAGADRQAEQAIDPEAVAERTLMRLLRRRLSYRIRRDPGDGDRQGSVEPSSMAHRLMSVRRPLVSVAVLGLLVACSAAESPDATPEAAASSLSQDEIAKAEAVAREVIADQGASVDSASVIARSGTVEDSNTSHPCTSGRELRIKLIGDFPRTVTTGHPVKPGSPPPDFTVRAMVITADAESGRACLIGVQTAENGEPKPVPGSTALSMG